MQSFIHRKNVEHYRKLLEQTAEESERRLLLKLLKDEEAKLESYARVRRDEQQS